MLVDGDAALDGLPLEPYLLYLIAPGAKPRLESIGGGRAMLLGGADFASERHIWWNFVGSSTTASAMRLIAGTGELSPRSRATAKSSSRSRKCR